MSNLQTLLDSEVTNLLEDLKSCQKGSDEYKEKLENLTKVYSILHKEQELVLESNKIETDYQLKDRQLDIESEKNSVNENLHLADNDVKKYEIDKANKSGNVWNTVKTVVEVGSVVAPLVFYGIWMSRGLEFEKEGSYTSNTFKGLIGKFKTTK